MLSYFSFRSIVLSFTLIEIDLVGSKLKYYERLRRKLACELSTVLPFKGYPWNDYLVN